MSVFLISMMKSRFLLFRPKAVDLSPFIFQDEIVKAYRIVSPAAGIQWHAFSKAVEAHRHSALISPKAELKVHDVLNVSSTRLSRSKKQTCL